MMASRIETLEQLLAQDSTDTTLHYMLGNEYFNAQMYDRAVTVLRKYLSLTDDEGAAYRLLAQSLDRLGKIPEARQAYQDGLAAARRHGHQPMIEEYTQALKDSE
jgi:Flp pilus assembly protein TadD